MFKLIPGIVILAMCASLLPATVASAEGTLVYSNDFDNGLGDFRKTDKKIQLTSQACAQGSKCVHISRENRRAYTHISRFFRVSQPGTLRFQARMKTQNLVPGTEDYHRAKFVGVVIEGGKEISWPNDDISTSTDAWELRSFDVIDLDPSVKVDLRIGLQNAKGSLFVDDLEVYFIPD